VFYIFSIKLFKYIYSNLPLNDVMFCIMTIGVCYSYFQGYQPYVVISDPEDIKQVIVKDFAHFTNRPVSKLKMASH